MQGIDFHGFRADRRGFGVDGTGVTTGARCRRPAHEYDVLGKDLSCRALIFMVSEQTGVDID